MVWMLLGSLKSSSEIATQNIVVLPGQSEPGPYRQGLVAGRHPAVVPEQRDRHGDRSVVKLVLALTTAYGLVFVRFPFKRVIFLAILVALMVPPQVALVPNYVLIAGLGGVNTYWGIILPGLGTAFGTFLLRQHFMALPPELLEAAEIDGAGHFRRLTQIVIPVSTPIIATVALVTIVNEWNDYLWPLVITNSADHMTLPVGLTLLQNTENDPSTFPVLMAGAVMVIIPVLIVFALLQRYIVAGLTQGAVK